MGNCLILESKLAMSLDVSMKDLSVYHYQYLSLILLLAVLKIYVHNLRHESRNIALYKRIYFLQN